ncbi:MAG: MotA/TolQ/ExbB proton channel family protein [Planctomycetota bacterium]
MKHCITKSIALGPLALIALLSAPAVAQDGANPPNASIEQIGKGIETRITEAVGELDALRTRIAAEKIPLDKRLGELEAELSQVRQEYQQKTRQLDGRALDLDNLRSEIKAREDERSYVSNLLTDYFRKFESQLHIAELHRYEGAIQKARLASENPALPDADKFAAQVALLGSSIDRLLDNLGGTSFKGAAIDATGLVKQGSFVLVGPIALFRSDDGSVVGSAEQRLGSLEPTVIPFADPKDAAAASALVANGSGELPLDVTLGNAHKIEATQETLLEHIEKGGPVMVPIFVVAGLALIVILYKWLSLSMLRRPSRRQLATLLEAVADQDDDAALEMAQSMRGPIGRMLAAGVAHINESKDLIEEVMYEKMLQTRLRLQRLLPFVAIAAASAPLLGLLGTVTGIIKTFKQITVFGAGDVKSLSGGISEALITTEYGLIVAIPSLLLHAFLSRKVRAVLGEMEAAGVALVNEASKSSRQRTVAVSSSPSGPGGVPLPEREMVRAQVQDILREMLGPLSDLGDPETATSNAKRSARVG